MSETSTKQVSGGIFARTSSGLVRTISTFDTFYYCVVQVAIPFVFFSVAYMVFYPGANLELSTLIALGAALSMGITYGLFSSIYPRSGGEYVPLSRATHPLIGFVASFAQVFWQTFATGQLAAFAATFGWATLFTVLGLQLGNQSLVDLGFWFDSPTGWFVVGSIMILLFSFLLNRGMATYFKVQKWLFTAALAGFVVFLLVLALGGAGVFDFQVSFDKYAGSGAYADMLANAEADGLDLSPAHSGTNTLNFVIWPALALLFAVLSTAFSGEIKNVTRGQLIAIPLAQLFAAGLMLLAGLLGRLAISQSGLLAAGWVSAVSPEKFPLPYVWLNGLASIMADNILLTIIINVSVTILTIYVAASTAIYATRGMLAWGIDGMAPSWLGEVSKKYRSPSNAIATVAVLGVAILAIYSFTDWIRILSALVGMGIVFTITTFVAAIFPYLKREVYEASPAKMEIFGIPVMTITGLIGSFVGVWIVYRAIVDVDFGANAPISKQIGAGVFIVGAIWYFVAKALRRRQGVNMNARFEEIPIE